MNKSQRSEVSKSRSNKSNKKDKDNQQKINKQQLKQVVLKYQNPSEKGYYTFQDWKSVHLAIFTLTEYHITSTVINAWRILKLINFGDDFVPTGLVYDTIMTVINVDETIDQTEYLLKSIFFKFIQFNGKYLTEKERQQLAFFKVVRSIVQGYRKIISSNLKNNENQLNQQKGADRNQQLYRLHNVLIYKRNLQKLKRIQGEFKGCTFQPELNEQVYMIQSRYLNSPKKSSQKKINQCIDQAQQYEEASRQAFKFKANPVPQYPQINPLGLDQHLQRMQRSRQIQRINQLKSSFKAKIPNASVCQFSINQRQKQRQLKLLQNIRILFMIKVQVGKRVYRVKVRQHMTIEQTVKAIQKMVGFKDQGIQDVVKGYFKNWQKRNKEAFDTYRQSLE